MKVIIWQGLELLTRQAWKAASDAPFDSEKVQHSWSKLLNGLVRSLSVELPLAASRDVQERVQSVVLNVAAAAACALRTANVGS
jgi:hypothetical protein